MAKGYVIAQINVADLETYPKCVALVQRTVEAFGGQSQSYEGTWPEDRHVVIEFPSFQLSNDLCHSIIYSGAKAVRQSASASVQTILEGVS